MNAAVRVPIIDQVVESIKESNIGGEIEVGAKLPAEHALCKTLAVSRSTVREAFRVLQTLGYVELKPGRGAFVRDTSSHDIDTIRNWFRESIPRLEDFTEVRGALELLAVRMAVRCCKDDEIRILEDLHAAFVKAVALGNVSEIARLDEEFHSRIFSMTRNTLLVNLNKLVAAEFKKYRVMSFSVEANCLSAVGPHGRILAAIKRRDADDGAARMAEHLNLIKSDMEMMVDS
jgi:GntR family transcriptional repressor for pyruvate dehydrogenase complex